MVERTDPARTGVKAGRVVGLLTAALAVATLLGVQDTYYASASTLLDAVGVAGQFDPLLDAAGRLGVDSDVAVPLLFWSNVAGAAVVRYAICYVVGSLVGVVYDWLDRESVAVLAGLVFVVGVVDGTLAGLDARSVAVGGAYLLAWLCYVPAFVRLHDPDAGDDRSGPLRLGES